MPCYFFAGEQYIRVKRGVLGPGTVDPGYPGPISVWGWGEFGKHGINAALYSGAVDYFFSGVEYIRVTRGDVGPGKVDAGYPRPISDWGWGEFGKNGIDAALYSGPVCYFFSGAEYIRVTRSGESLGKIDQGYPKPISVWGWGEFGKNGIDAALNSGPVDYFFSGAEYIRVTRGDEGPGKVDPGYPGPISVWGWKEFGAHGINAALFSGVDTIQAPPPPPPPPSPPVQTQTYTFDQFNAGHVTVESMTVSFSSDGKWQWEAGLHDDSTFSGDTWALGFVIMGTDHGAATSGSLGATLSGPSADDGVHKGGTDAWLAQNYAQATKGITARLHVHGDVGQLLSSLEEDLVAAAQVIGQVAGAVLKGLSGSDGDDQDGGDGDEQVRRPPIATATTGPMIKVSAKPRP